jgi:ParB-like chromosome segregation protein Spo0J
VFKKESERKNMEIITRKLSEIKPYEKNPRKNDQAVEAVANSIKEFGWQQPLVIDKDGIIIIGHTRLKAAKSLGMDEVPCVVASDLTDEQIKALRLADNKVGELAEWDEVLLNLELDEILDIDMSDFGFLEEELEETIGKYDDARNDKNLQERFGVPPFSVLDTRQGYWQDRKKKWKELGIKSETGRKDNLISDGIKQLNINNKSNMSATSIFDPVLCEIAYKWYCTDGGCIFDPFAGGSVRGIVAAKLGYKYKGIDLRKEQIDANYENASELDLKVEWYCDDSQNADLYVDDNTADMVFSCPPYADLEVYSDDPRDISNMDYDDFIKIYRNIIHKACNKLKDNRFAVWVIGDVRDKKGFYRDFITDTKQAFYDSGLKLYNELILIEAGGTASIRAGKVFQAGRKTVKMHQNVLVFYKGDPKEIKNNYGEIYIDNLSEESEE